jgi:hypothetical protein
MPLKKEQIIKDYGLTDEDLISIPSFSFLPATFVGGIWKNTFLVREEHTLYDAQVAAQLTYERTGVWIATTVPETNEANEVTSLILNEPRKEKPTVLPPHRVPRRCRRTMAAIVAPWISNDGPKMGVFCATCLYTKEQNSFYTPADFLEHLKTCRIQPVDKKQYMNRHYIAERRMNVLRLA